MDLNRFPQRNQGDTRTVFVESITDEEQIQLNSRGYSAVHLFSLPRVTEADHKAYLMALTQGMAEGTIEANKSRLDAAELDLRAHGMLNKEVTHQEADRGRDKTVEEMIATFDKRSRHVLFTTTITDPKVVEAFLLKEAGLMKPQEEATAGGKRLWRRKRKGNDEE